MTSIPTHLYKYRSLIGESRDRTRKAIVGTEVYFSCCKQFNDPFDCRLNVRGDFSLDDRRQMDTATESAGILCLSECNDSLLMWSHYADAHRGICIEYSTSEEKLFGCSVDRVLYASVYPEMSLADTPDLEWVRRSLSTKSDHWNYEKEWRIFHQLGVKLAPPEELSAVILGCMMSDKDRDAVCEWVASRSVPTRLYEALRDDGVFRIQVVPFRSEA